MRHERWNFCSVKNYPFQKSKKIKAFSNAFRLPSSGSGDVQTEQCSFREGERVLYRAELTSYLTGKDEGRGRRNGGREEGGRETERQRGKEGGGTSDGNLQVVCSVEWRLQCLVYSL